MHRKLVFPSIIIIFFSLMGGLFGWHLITGRYIEPVAYFFQPLNLSIYWSTIFIVAGILMGSVAAERYGRKLHQRFLNQSNVPWISDNVWSVLIPCLVWGLIGARLEVILFPSPSLSQIGINAIRDFIDSPYLIINLSAGGLGISGAIVGGLIGLFTFCRRKKLSFLLWVDTAVFGLALGQSIGRWGDFVNQEFYGRFSSLPWAIKIESGARLPEVVQFETFHPVFLYESLWTLLLFFVLIYFLNNYADHLRVGMLGCGYLLFYAVGRIVLAFFRLDQPLFLFQAFEFPIIIGFSITIIAITSSHLLFVSPYQK